jgi:hypothetical protein
LFQQNRILWHFIYFQATTHPDQLDVKKSEYQRQEAILVKSHRRVFLIPAIFVVIYVILLVISSGDDEFILQLSYYFSAGSTIVFSWFMMTSIFIGFLYLQAMYFFQKFEFRRHRFRVGVSILTIGSALFNLVEQVYGFSVLTGCKLDY